MLHKIKSIFIFIFIYLTSFNSYAGIDSEINKLTSPIAETFSKFVFFKISLFGAQLPVIVLLLIISAVIFTFYMNFINIKGFKHAIELISGKHDKPSSKGEISHFQALMTAISGTVGIGNIAGVAVAISVGGVGATFWMVVAGFLGMSTKFVECTLGVKYRKHNKDSSFSGGPMYYLTHGLAELNFPKLGRFLGIFFAIGLVLGALGIGNMFQSNQAFVQLNYITGGLLNNYGWLIGFIFAFMVFIVIVGGIKSIARVTEKMVPFMALLYCISALVVIFMNIEFLPTAILNIFNGAFSSKGLTGGMLGAMIVGFQRAVFSNEAGIGSASIAHAAVKTNQPITEGIVAILGPFIDTIIICSLTALVISVISVAVPGFAGEATGIAMTSAAFESQISWFPYLIALAGLLFAFSTMISWSYYGLKAWTYLFGQDKELIYKLIFCVFVMLGCMVKLTPILNISDALVFLICIPNIIGLYMLAPIVKKDLKAYWLNQK
ncbi:MAG: alanine:cation symporter family protein [Bdellovibrionales bacterium]|nr:alanine:cation symporter family protein [Bdellovibrionales bacterium]